MKLLIDGVFFQLAQSGIARVWRSILPILVAKPGLDVFVLDRGGMPPIEGAMRIPFPTYKDFYNADDSALIQRVCDAWGIDAFTSTYYTTPLTTPMFLIVYDLIPEVYGFDLTHRHWQEKSLAIAYARRHICISQCTRDDLLRHYPGFDRTMVAHLGCDRTVFRQVDGEDVTAFRRSVGFDRRPYVVTVGSREQHLGYKNGRLLFDAITELGFDDFDILCIGGEPGIGAEVLAAIPPKVKVERLSLSDTELAAAYSGAAGLIYPSLYEGFGLPVLEAMSCGCPVVTTSRGSLSEVAGDACLAIDGSSRMELVAALKLLGTASKRQDLRRAGLERSMAFDWSVIASATIEATTEMAQLKNNADYRRFASKWCSLRQMQSAVDVDLWR